MPMDFKFNTIDEAIQDIATGKMVVVIDDESRENEGDLVMSAQMITPEAVNFMITYGKGLVCFPMSEAIAKQLQLDLMVECNTESMKTAFTVSVDANASYGVTTGISPKDRAKTIQVAINPASQPSDLVRPGHIFPLVSQQGGVLKRAGHTEAAVDLSRAAGLVEAGVICEIIKDDGDMSRTPDLKKFCVKHGLKIITIADLIAYQLKKNPFVIQKAKAKLPLQQGAFEIVGFEDTLRHHEHVALVFGDYLNQKHVLVRIHSECLTGDTLGSLRCDCGPQLEAAIDLIAKNGSGILVYMRQEGRGIGLINKLRAYELQDQGKDTVEANIDLGFAPDLRDYGVGAQILHLLGVQHINILTNNPKKVVGLEGYGITIHERIPLVIQSNPHNRKYLATKSTKMGHYINKEALT